MVHGEPQRLTVLLRTSAAVYLGTADGDPRLVLVDDGGIAVPDCAMLPAGLRWRDLLTAQDRTGAPILVGAGEVRCGPRAVPVRADLDLTVPTIQPAVAEQGLVHLRTALATAIRRRSAWPVVHHQWSTGAASPEALATDARRLIGRGPGVTPTGDDILAGAILAHVALGTPGIAAAATGIVDLARGRTTAASIVSLRGAAGARAATPLRDLLRAIGEQGDPTASLGRVLRLGHTSGADLLRGLHDGFAAAVPAAPAAPADCTPSAVLTASAAPRARAAPTAHVRQSHPPRASVPPAPIPARPRAAAERKAS